MTASTQRQPGAPFTQRTAEVLAFMMAYFEEFDRLPAISALRLHFDWTCNTIAIRHLHRLRERGYIEKVSGQAYRFSRSWPGRPVVQIPSATLSTPPT